MDESVERVRTFLAARAETLPFPHDPIVDIDLGSRGHVRLLQSDIEALLEVAGLVTSE